MDEINSKKLRVKKVCLDLILSSTIHGIPNIFKSKNTLVKILWMFFTCLSVALCFYMFTENIKNFLKYEVTTTTRQINEYKSLFPTVTICNLNKYTSNIDSFTLDSTLGLYTIDPLIVYFQLNIQGLDRNISQTSDSYEKLIVLCEFNTKPCDAKNFSHFLHPKYGNCYQFNSGFNMNGSIIEKNKIMLTDRMLGLRLVLNSSVSDKLKFTSPIDGVVILIHNHTKNPLMDQELTISPKTETNIALSRTFFNAYPKPYSDCDKNTNDINSYDSEYFKIVHLNVKEYSQNLCVYQCFQKKFISDCKCYFPNMPCFYKSNACGIEQSYCLDEVLLFLENNDYFEDECINNCPLECETMNFDKTITSSKFSNPFYEFMLSGLLSNSTKNIYFNKTIDSNDLAVVNIYYKTLSYIVFNENPKIDSVTLLSNIGGIAGLFLGMSFLTLVEFIELIIKILLSMTNSKKIHQSI